MGEIQLKCSAFPDFAVHPDVATALLDDSIYRREPEPCPPTRFLRGIERLKDAGLGRLIHAAARV